MCSFGASYLNTYLANKSDWESESMSLKATIVPIFFLLFFCFNKSLPKNTKIRYHNELQFKDNKGSAYFTPS